MATTALTVIPAEQDQKVKPVKTASLVPWAQWVTKDQEVKLAQLVMLAEMAKTEKTVLMEDQV
jgi:hypothetical protein